MVNKIWGFFIIVGITVCVITGNLDKVNYEILNSTKVSLELIIKIFPVVALWLGIMNIAKVAGLLDLLANAISPFLRKLFPEIPKGHESLGFIASNIVINMFGLGSAATPFGLKAMQSLQKLNQKKDTASRSMITFLIINTSGVTLIPTTVISMRMMYESAHPTEIVGACIVATSISMICAVLIDYFVARRKVK
ncbi:MAG: nucleoside recognition domain-containing protein [Bacilli bacterium]|nr:nucleoside recognition domain-containing protein [Bacilli bacterium]